MASFAGACCLTVGLLLFSLTSLAEENCDVPIAELNKIDQTLTHIKKTIYVEESESESSDSDECAQMLRGIHRQLRRLTQKYKLMNTGYVQAEEYQKMANDYQAQLTKLKGEFEHFRVETKSIAEQKMKELKKDITALEQNVSKLHDRLQSITDELGKVTRDLCFTFLESKQLDNAKEKMKHLPSKYAIELVDQFLNKNEEDWLPVIDLSLAVPDLDDRGQVYKNIYKFLLDKNRLEGEETILLEAVILKLNATFHPGSKITDDRKKEIKELLENLSKFSEKTFEQWTLELNQSAISAVVFKNAIDHMFLTQMEKLGEQVIARKHYFTERNFLRLLGVSKNNHKIAAYNKLVENKIGHAMAAVMIDMLSIDRADIKHEPDVPDLIEKIYNDTISKLPDSLKTIISCINAVKITNQDNNLCILTTNEFVNVVNPKYEHITVGKSKPVTTGSANCTSFRLELSPTKPYVKIISSAGNALMNINSPMPDSTWFTRVVAPYVNYPNMYLDHSADWILNANFVNNSIKIQTEFNANNNRDHLVSRKVADITVAKYGYLGMVYGGVKDHQAEWMIQCY